MNPLKKILLIVLIGLALNSCSLREEPTFLSEASAYSNLTNATATLDGIYSAVAAYRYFGNDFMYATYGNSGFFVSGIQSSNQSTDNRFLCSLKPQPSATYNENTWEYLYIAIDRANSLIQQVKEINEPNSDDEYAWNNILGEAYFLRSFCYFNLVRLWGEVPLRIQPTTKENVHMAKSTTDVVYSQILEDADMAKRLMYPKGSEREGFPAREAANMLKAKVYMQMATTEDAVPVATEGNYWQMAYDEAKEVYGKYALVSDFATLWQETEGNNTVEAIFEIQFNDLARSNYVKLFTASNALKGNTWGRLRINAELYDSHNNTYPEDNIRLQNTFVTGYTKQNNGKYQKVYPETTNRNSFNNAFCYLYKYWEKNIENTANYNFQNFMVYRYADLLLMLAEISNELQNGEEFIYLNEVLSRVGQSPHGEYYNGQEAFRWSIMYEYRFELLGEAHDWFNNRRRGYDWFNTEVIIPHNTYVRFNENVDVTLDDNRETVMHLPIPTSEINTNDLIDN